MNKDLDTYLTSSNTYLRQHLRQIRILLSAILRQVGPVRIKRTLIDAEEEDVFVVSRDAATGDFIFSVKERK